MLCVYKHSTVAITTNSRIVCMHCKQTFSAEKLMHVLVQAQLLVMKQMNDSQIWQNFEDNEDAKYIKNQLGKLHCIVEDLDL